MAEVEINDEEDEMKDEDEQMKDEEDEKDEEKAGGSWTQLRQQCWFFSTFQKISEVHLSVYRSNSINPCI